LTVHHAYQSGAKKALERREALRVSPPSSPNVGDLEFDWKNFPLQGVAKILIKEEGQQSGMGKLRRGKEREGPLPY